MIEFPVILGPDGRPIVMQKNTHPAVYLDTWALRLFAEGEPALGQRFRDALLRVRGTLMLSLLSFGEFTSFDDPRHARTVGAFVDSINPHIFFSQFDPFQVIPAEYSIIAGQRNGTPAGDVRLLDLYAARRTGPPHPSISDWFDYSIDRAQYRAEIDEMAQRFLNGIAELRNRFAAEPDFVKLALENVKVSTLPRVTQALLRALIYRLDPKMTLDVNDALDIAHCIVPAAYADFVLLDRRWYVRLKDAERFLRSVNIETLIAEQYTQRDGGVLKLLERLEAWPPKPEGRTRGLPLGGVT
jgi:hypothetical protein